jgi:small subunit ribosomal protein S5
MKSTPIRDGGSDGTKEFFEEVVQISRVNKVVKGGRRMSFRVFVVVGDQNGKIGLGLGKSKEVPLGIKNALAQAKKSMFAIKGVDRTVNHEVQARFGGATVVIRPAKPGTGIIAGGSVRVVLQALGVNDVVAKCHGSNNPMNAAKATVMALECLRDYDEECAFRGVKFFVSDVQKKTRTAVKQTELEVETNEQ